jgi:CBS domain-containing protein
MMTAGEIMTANLITVRPETSVAEAIELLLNTNISGLPVVDSTGHLKGIITEFALLELAYDQRMKSDSVNKYMTLNVIAVDVSDTISRVAYLCLAHRVRRLPVLTNGRLVGIIARRDVLRALLGLPAELACARA